MRYKLTRDEYDELKDFVWKMMRYKNFDITEQVLIVFDNDNRLLAIKSKKYAWSWTVMWFAGYPDEDKNRLYEVGEICDSSVELEYLIDHQIEVIESRCPGH